MALEIDRCDLISRVWCWPGLLITPIAMHLIFRSRARDETACTAPLRPGPNDWSVARLLETTLDPAGDSRLDGFSRQLDRRLRQWTRGDQSVGEVIGHFTDGLGGNVHEHFS